MLLRSVRQPLLLPLKTAVAVGRPLGASFANNCSDTVSTGPRRQASPTKSAVKDQHSSKSSSTLDKTLASRLVPLLPALYAFPAAADSSAYSPGAGADVVKNIAGTAYAALLAFWLFKVIGRRVKRGQTEVIASLLWASSAPAQP